MRRRRMRVGRTVLLVLLGGGLSLDVSAAAAGRPRHPDRAPAYFYGFAGALDADDDPSGIGDPGNGLILGFGGGLRRNPHLALELEVTADRRDYDVPQGTPNPLFGRVDELVLTSSFVSFSVKGIYPVSRLELFAGAGAGLNFTELKLTGSLLGIPGTFERERELTLAVQARIGFDVAVSPRASFGLELREIVADADYGALSGGTVDVGGRALALTYRRHF